MISFLGEHQLATNQDHRRKYTKAEMLSMTAFDSKGNESFLGSTSLSRKKAVDHLEAMLLFTAIHCIELNQLRLIGYDGAPVNTGYKGGLGFLMETELERELQRVCCMLHLCELLLRHVFIFCNANITPASGDTFRGPIGQRLKSVGSLPIVDFEPIAGVTVANVPKDLNADHHYLWTAALAVSTKNVPENFASLEIGPLSLARWFTLGSRVLRLYLGDDDPSILLVVLVRFIIEVYLPLVSNIKTFSQVYYGAKHFFFAVEKTRTFPKDIRSIIHRVLTDNYSMGHPESLLLAAVVDEIKSNREFAVNKIREARQFKRSNGMC